jgi:hypothetical protein
MHVLYLNQQDWETDHYWVLFIQNVIYKFVVLFILINKLPLRINPLSELIMYADDTSVIL